MIIINAHAIRAREPLQGWEVTEWTGKPCFVVQLAWNRFFQFVGQRMTITIMSDDWGLGYDEAYILAKEIASGKRTYMSINLNEEKATWRKVW